jgi:hypothetical protein
VICAQYLLELGNCGGQTNDRCAEDEYGLEAFEIDTKFGLLKAVIDGFYYLALQFEQVGSQRFSG